MELEGNMKKMVFLFILIFLLPACGPVNSGDAAITSCSTTVDGLAALFSEYELPQYFMAENPAKQGGEFDVMEIFTILDHLSMKPGYVLDYVYRYAGIGGFPVLYVRPVEQAPYTTDADLSAAGETPNYLDYIQTNDTPESYFQFILLAIYGDQFYLYWHANYSDRTITCDKDAVNRIVSSLDGSFGYRISTSSRVRAELLTGLEPNVSIGEQVVEVQFVMFTKWGGFFKETYQINRQEPHTIQDVQEKNLIPYDCGVMF
jgi:hypothetical protein